MVGLGQRVAAHARGTPVLHEDLDRAPLGAALAGAGHPVTLGRRRRLAARGVKALVSGAEAVAGGAEAQPVPTQVAVAPDAMMKVRLVSFMAPRDSIQWNFARFAPQFVLST